MTFILDLIVVVIILAPIIKKWASTTDTDEKPENNKE